MSDHLAQRVALRHHLAVRKAAVNEVQGLLAEGLGSLKKYRAWIRGFDSMLKNADREGLPSGYVWQDDVVDFLRPFDAIQREVIDLLDRLEDVDPQLWKDAHPLLDPPKQAQIEFALAKPKFIQLPGEPYSRIASPEAQLKKWDRNFTSWVDRSLSNFRSVSQKS